MTKRASGSLRWRDTALVIATAASAVVATTRCSDPTSSENGTISPSGPNKSPALPEGPAASTSSGAGTPQRPEDAVVTFARKQIEEGRKTFRYDTFGDEDFWGGTLRLHEAVATVSPKTALAVGLKIDADALPNDVVNALKQGKLDLDSPATTLAVLKLDAVVGVKGFFQGDKLSSLGIQCAFCHSTVDDSFAPGIGHRLDGWPNRDLDVGKIVDLSPDLSPVANVLGVPVDTVHAVLQSWGKGRFDAELFLDGKAFRPDSSTAATLIPAAYGLAGVNLHTYEGWGSITQWNAFVANLEMHGKGTYLDSRLDDAERFPIAAANKLGHTRAPVDLITPKLAALHYYQLSLEAPTPKPGTFDAAASARGKSVFEGAGKCSTCHVPPLFTEPGWNMHTGDEIGIDDFQSSRSPDRRYRTAPLRGMSGHAKGGFYHDGRFPTLAAVVDHYDTAKALGLTAAQKKDLTEFLKSL